MIGITTYCIVLTLLASTRVVRAIESEVREESKVSIKDSIANVQPRLSIFRSDLSREYLATSALGIDDTLSTRRTLKNYLHNCNTDQDICMCSIISYPPEQTYSIMIERSNFNKRSNYREHSSVESLSSDRKVTEFMGRAIWIDSFLQQNAFIDSIEPLQVLDVALFWDTIWHNNVRVIVAIKQLEEEESSDYWPVEDARTMKVSFGSYMLTNVRNDDYPSDGYKCSQLEMINLRLRRRRRANRAVTHCQFTKWPPNTSKPFRTAHLLAFRRHVKALASAQIDSGTPPQSVERPPILIHSSTERARTYIFVAIDVLIERMDTEPGHPVDIAGVVGRLRLLQPEFAITKAQYEFCAHALRVHVCTGPEQLR